MIQSRAGQVTANHDGACEICVAQVFPGQIDARKVHPGKDRACAARLRLPQPIMPGANPLHVGLRQTERGLSCS